MQTAHSRHTQRQISGKVIAFIVVPLALCVTCVSVVVVPRVRGALETSREAVSNQLAESVATSLAARIAAWPAGADTLLITSSDLDVNNADVPGEWGMTTGTDGTRLWGIATDISPAGITLLMGDTVTYTGMPGVAAGRVELTDVVISGAMPFKLLTADGFADGMERGINQALDSHALVPIAITLGTGVMMIETVPRAQDI